MLANEQEKIAEYLALHGATKCPTVSLVKTTAKYKTDKKMLKRHQEKQSAQAEAFFNKTFRNRMFFFFIGLVHIPLLEYLT